MPLCQNQRLENNKMKSITLLATIFFIISCSDAILPVKDNKLKHAGLGFELEEPDTILNELAGGRLDKNINSVLCQLFDEFPEPAESRWEFKYLQNSDQVSEMTFFHTSTETAYVFYYNGKSEIDSIVSNWLGTDVKRLYTFNYNEKGVLKSIYMDSDYFLEENYFGYYPNGKIKEIYNSFRGSTDGVHFNKQEFFYDSTFSNVTKVNFTTDSPYNYSYEFIYDNNKNPYKGFYIAASVYLPSIANSACLSDNNVVVAKKKYANSGNVSDHFYSFYYENNELVSYSERDTTTIPFVRYSVNK